MTIAFLPSRSSRLSPKNLVMPLITGRRVAARALAAGMINERTRLTANIAQITPLTVLTFIQLSRESATRRSRPAACMIAAKMKAERQRNTTGVANPSAALEKGLAAPLMTSSIGISRPETPAGSASKTHIVHAHATTASVALPAGDRPAGAGIPNRIRKKINQARAKPTKVLRRGSPAAAMFARNCWKKWRLEIDSQIPVARLACCLVSAIGSSWLQFAGARERANYNENFFAFLQRRIVLAQYLQHLRAAELLRDIGALGQCLAQLGPRQL